MLITEHKSFRGEPFYKGVTQHAGKRLTFFGWSRAHVIRKENDWIAANLEQLNARSKGRPILRVIRGGAG